MSYYVIGSQIKMKIEGIAARINQNGRVVIPAVIRKAMGLKLGDTILMSLEDGVLRIEPEFARIRRIQAESKPFANSASLASDELTAERREKAQRETEDWLG